MKKALIIILAVLVVAVSGFGGYVLYESSKGISYDISALEKLSSDIEIVSEGEDSVTVKKMSDGEFRVLMFTDTHLKGDKELDNITVTNMVKVATSGADKDAAEIYIGKAIFARPIESDGFF